MCNNILRLIKIKWSTEAQYNLVFKLRYAMINVGGENLCHLQPHNRNTSGYAFLYIVM